MSEIGFVVFLQEEPAKADDENQRQDPFKGLVVLAEVWAEANQGVPISTVRF